MAGSVTRYSRFRSTKSSSCWLRSAAVLAAVFICLALSWPARPAAAQFVGGINASLNAAPTNVAVGQVVTFSYTVSPPAVAPPFASIDSVFVNYGDGQVDSGSTGAPGQTVSGTLTHVYSSSGPFTATLAATASNGASGGDSTTVIVGGGGGGGGLVQVSVTASSNYVPVGQSVSFTYSATPSFGIGFPQIRSMLINYGDGSPLPLTPPSGTVPHTYSSPGTYSVLVTAVDSSGQNGQASTSITVYGSGGGGNQGVQVSVSAFPSYAPVGQSVSFNYSATSSFGIGFPQIRSLLIGYGDGAPLPLNSPSGTVSHTYYAPGSYTVLLTATDSTGASGQATTSVTIYGSSTPSGQPPTNVQIVFSPGSLALGQPGTFNAATALAANPGAYIQSYSWSFGDGGISSGQNVTHAYTSPGSYGVTLTVADSTGASTQTGTQVQVGGGSPNAPSVSITYQAGWNLISAPTGTPITGVAGPLYTLQSGDSYSTAQSVQSGLGYWAFFPITTTVNLLPSSPITMTRGLPPGQFIMIGNPGTTSATVSGADIVYTYSVATGYQATTVLQPGQGGWAISVFGGNVTIVNSGS